MDKIPLAGKMSILETMNMYLSYTDQLGFIGKKKISRTKADSIRINQVCHIGHIIDTRVVAASVGSTSKDVGAGFSKVAVLIIVCSSDGELRGHRLGKILHNVRILMGVCGFIWSCIVCSIF